MYIEDEDNCYKYYELGEKNAKTNFFFMISWGLSLQHFKKHEESKEKFKMAIEMAPENELGPSSLGIANFETKNYEEAEKCFNRALEINPQNVISLDKIGDINFDRENYDEAIEYYKKVLSISAEFVQNYAKIAKIYFLKQDFENSNKYYEKAIEYSPKNTKLLSEYAQALIAQKEYRTAIRKLRAALKLENDDLESLQVLFYVNYLLAKENIYDYNVKEAMEIAEKIEKKYPGEFRYIKEKGELESLRKDKTENPQD
jgi:tetratricopeptide (TPR) repeat protein